MSVSRQDAWTPDEDLILAEFVLRHIREGSTQLVAFEEVGKRLSRTTAACGFRWNSYVRKQYTSGIELAKKQRKEGRKQLLKEKQDKPLLEEIQKGEQQVKPLNLEQVISFLESLKTQQDWQVEANRNVKDEMALLVEENAQLKQEMAQLEEKLDQIEEDYLALIEIMDKARKMVVLEESKKNAKVKFQMDKNGNLERMK